MVTMLTLPHRAAGIAIDPQAGRLFVLGAAVSPDEPGLVSTVDTATGALLNTVAVGAHLGGVIVAPAAGRVFLITGNQRARAHQSKMTITMMESATGRVLRHTEMDGPTQDMAVNEDTGQLFISAFDTIIVLDVRHGTVLHTIPVDGAVQRVVPVPQSERLFVILDPVDAQGLIPIEPSPARVTQIDVPRGRVVSETSVGREPFAVALDRATQRLFLVNRLDSTLSALDISTGTLQDTIPLSPAPLEGGCCDAGIVIDGPANRAVIVTARDQTVRVLDTRQGRILATLTPSTERSDLTGQVRFHQRTGHALVEGLRGLRIVDPRTGSLIRTIDLHVRSMVLDERGGQAFVLGPGEVGGGGHLQGGTIAMLDATGW